MADFFFTLHLGANVGVGAAHPQRIACGVALYYLAAILNPYPFTTAVLNAVLARVELTVASQVTMQARKRLLAVSRVYFVIPGIRRDGGEFFSLVAKHVGPAFVDLQRVAVQVTLPGADAGGSDHPC